MFTLLLVVLASSVLLLLSFIRARPVAGVKQAQGAKPILGNMPGVMANMHRLPLWLYEQAAAANFDNFGYCGPGMQVFRDTVLDSLIMQSSAQFLQLTTPEQVEHVFKKNFDCYEKGAVFRDCFSALLGQGIFAADGDVWRQQRKIARCAFQH